MFLGILLLLQTGGMLLLYKAQEITIQLRMAQVLETAEAGFEEISLSEDEYRNAIIDKNEILVNGKVYDIKSHRSDGNKVIVTAMEDKEEEGVLRNIRKAVNSSSSKNVPDDLLDLLTITYILPSAHCLEFYLMPPPRYFGAGVDSLLYYTPGIIIPPPELV